eukprot:15174013-Alexandrium_andersonii.AAC.1
MFEGIWIPTITAELATPPHCGKWYPKGWHGRELMFAGVRVSVRACMHAARAVQAVNAVRA